MSMDSIFTTEDEKFVAALPQVGVGWTSESCQTPSNK
jgi:hypothetical protein